MTLYIFILIGIYFEIKIYKKILTPLVALFGPVMIALLIMDMIEPRISTLIYKKYILNITIIWLSIGIIIKKVLYFKKEKKYNNFSDNFIKFLGSLVIITMIMNIINNIYIYGIHNLKGKLGGMSEHLFILTSVFLSVELIKKKGRVFKIIYLLIILLLVIRGGKYLIFLFVLPSILFYIEKEKNISIKLFWKIILIIFIVNLTFFCVYFINFYLSDIKLSTQEFMKFSLEHTKYYFLSPIYIGSELIKTPRFGKFEETFAPFINIYQFITREKNYIDSILTIKIVHGIKSNVGGLIPELIYNVGVTGMYLYMIFLGIISYILENLSLKNKAWEYSNLILKSSLILCFFNNVFSVLGYVERVIGTVIITIIIFRKIKIYQGRKGK